MSNKVVICGINTATLPKISEEKSNELLQKIKLGEKGAREEFVVANMRLVLSVIKRFRLKNVNIDDVFQAGCIGLIKAIDNFDLSFGVKFSTYAVPMMFVQRDANTSIGGKFVNEHSRETSNHEKSRNL